MKKCEMCEFWKQHKPEGTCSQFVKTDKGLVKQITPSDYSCSLFEEDKTKFDFRLWISKDDKVHITGTYSKNTVKKAIEKLLEIEKEY